MLDDDNKTLRTVAWPQICPWLIIFRTFRLAIGFRTLLLAAVAAMVTLGGWALFARLFALDADAPTAAWMSPKDGCPWHAIDAAVDDSPRLPEVTDFQEAFLQDTASGDSAMPGNPFYGTWVQLSRPLLATFDPAVTTGAESSQALKSLACLLLCGLWALATWAFFGGAITRIAAVQLAADERIGWGAALRFACSKWVSYFFAVLTPLIGMLVVAAITLVVILIAGTPVWILALIMGWNVGVCLAAVFWPLVLLAGLVMAVLLLGLLFGWPLMWATISTEGKDSFDALQRSYDYTLHRPLHYLFYAIVASVLGGLGWLLVKNFAAAVVGLSFWSAGWFADWEIMTDNGAIRFWTIGVKLLAVGYIYGYFWTASVAIYLLLRRDVDATEMDEVFLDEDAAEGAYGLPALSTDEAGAPVSNEDGNAPEAIPEIEPDDEPTGDESPGDGPPGEPPTEDPGRAPQANE